MSKLSVVISAYNEEHMIGECLRSVDWADEIIVVDNQSTDKTKEIARSLGAKVITKPNKAMLNINKNVGFTHASHDWILNLDADERIPVNLKEEILNTIRSESASEGYRIPRKNIIFGKWIKNGLWWPDYQIRLFKKNKGKFPCIHVHEYIQIEGTISELKTPFVHENYQSVSQYLTKLNTLYTENEVELKFRNGYKLHWHDAIRYPLADFFSIYFSKKGYEDGLHGLVLALFQSMYSFVVFAKLWEKHKFIEKEISSHMLEEEFKYASKQLSYWRLTRMIIASTNPFMKMMLKLKRKLI